MPRRKTGKIEVDFEFDEEEQDCILADAIASIVFQPSLVETPENKAIADRHSKDTVNRFSKNIEKLLENANGSTRKVRLTT